MNKKKIQQWIWRLVAAVLAFCMLLMLFAPAFAEDWRQADQGTLSSLYNSGLTMTLRKRNEAGQWQVSRLPLNADNVTAPVWEDESQRILWMDLNPAVVPAGYVNYSGIFRNEPGSEPLGDAFTEGENGIRYIGMKGTSFSVFRDSQGRWQFGSGFAAQPTVDLYVAKAPSFNFLSGVKIPFRSQKSGKVEWVNLIENSYQITHLNEEQEQPSCIVTIKTDMYVPELEKRTGSFVRFENTPAGIGATGMDRQDRSGFLDRDAQGNWTFFTPPLDAAGLPIDEGEGIGFLEEENRPGQIRMHRLYNPNSGEHFYTADTAERNNLVRLGWKSEGIGWIAPAQGTPVYRLYNANAGDHHYTLDLNERNFLIKAGWKDEGIGWFSAPETGLPLYRQYNPNARAGSHNYTLNKAENDELVRLGWRAEGISWYGLAQ